VTERRRARAKAPMAERAGVVPASLLIGACVEVWADPEAKSRQFSAFRRFSDARNAWASAHDVGPGELPSSSTWSVEFLSYRGQAERVGRPVEELVAERLGKAGCTVDDLPALADEADELYAASLGGALGRAYRRAKTKKSVA
jgi:hypothetical protein